MILEITLTNQQEKHLQKTAPALGVHFERTGQGMLGAEYRLTFDNTRDLWYLATLIATDVTIERMSQPQGALQN